MICFGIDFGTSNSCLAVFDGRRLAVVEPEGNRLPGARIYPSVVAFDQGGNPVAAGWQALNLAGPYLLVDQVKRWIGKPYAEVITDPRIRKLGYQIVEKDGKAQVQVGPKTCQPEEIVTYLLGRIVREGLAYLGRNGIETGGKISVVVTYPAYYTQNQVDAIRAAVRQVPAAVGEISFESVRLIPEPTASVCAALHAGRLTKSDRYVMVIDEGAGTLDTLLVDLHQLGFSDVEARGISIGGQAMLGGSDMDTRLLDWVIEELRKDPKVTPEALRGLNLRQLRSRVEAAKIDLSEGRTKQVQLKVPGVFRFVGLTELHLEALVGPVLDRCEEEVNSSLTRFEQMYGVSRKDIGRIILVGGPTRMVAFRKLVLRALPFSEIVEVNPMECVAEGAAVSSAVHYQIPAERTYGLLKRHRDRDTFVEIIRKDTPLPAGGIRAWNVKAFEGVAIEPAQVLSRSDTEISCLTMGVYTFPPAPADRIYYVALRLDDERNVYVVLSTSREVAQRCLDGSPEGGDFRLEFRREVSTRLIQIAQEDLFADGEDGDEQAFWRLFSEEGYGIQARLLDARDRLEECKRIIAEFGEAGQGVRSLAQRKNEVEYCVNRIHGRINGMYGIARGDRSPEARSRLRELVSEILRSEDMADLARETEALQKAIGSLELAYDRAKILELISRISATKSEAWVKVQKGSGRLAPAALGAIESTVGELEAIQGALEHLGQIRLGSAEAEQFRRGRIKEQELRNKIDNLVTQD